MFRRKEKGIPLPPKPIKDKTHTITGEDFSMKIELWKNCQGNYGWTLEGDFEKTITEPQGTHFLFQQEELVCDDVDDCYEGIVDFLCSIGLESLSQRVEAAKETILIEAWKRSLD